MWKEVLRQPPWNLCGMIRGRPPPTGHLRIDEMKAEEWNAGRPTVDSACGDLSAEPHAELHFEADSSIRRCPGPETDSWEDDMPGTYLFQAELQVLKDPKWISSAYQSLFWRQLKRKIKYIQNKWKHYMLPGGGCILKQTFSSKFPRFTFVGLILLKNNLFM